MKRRNLLMMRCTIVGGNCNLLEHHVFWGYDNSEKIFNLLDSSLNCFWFRIITFVPIFSVSNSEFSHLIVSEWCGDNFCSILRALPWINIMGDVRLYSDKIWALELFLNCNCLNPNCTGWCDISLCISENENWVLFDEPYDLLNMCCKFFEIVLIALASKCNDIGCLTHTQQRLLMFHISFRKDFLDNPRE